VLVGAGAALVWCALFAAAWQRLYSYAYRPEATGLSVTSWPQDATCAPSSGFRLVVFIHPLCPCTQATLQELDESLARMPEGVVVVVPVTAGLSESDVAASRLLAAVRNMPRVRLHVDPAGEERRRFGARVSGEVFAFDDRGRRMFHGGLTPGRGHQGDAPGQRQLEELARGARHEACESPMFGCLLPGSEHAHSRQAVVSCQRAR
jgi:hypothetical protein